MKAKRIIVACVLAIAAVVLGVMCVESVTTPINFENDRKAREVEVIKHLVDLRTAEVEYHHVNGNFTANLDSLMIFLKTTPKKEVLKEGNLTEEQLEQMKLSEQKAEQKAVKIIENAMAKALKNKKLNLDPNDKDALYAYVWANDPEVKQYKLQGFRRDTIEQNMLLTLYKGEYDENSIDQIIEIPFSEGKRFEVEVNNDYKTSQGIRVPLFEIRAPFESYLSDLNKQELVNLQDSEEKKGHYAGLKVGDVEAPNNNAGNWE